MDVSRLGLPAGRETTSVGEANAKHVLQQRVLQLYKDNDLLRDEIYTAVSKLPDSTCYQYVRIYVTEETVKSPYLAMAAKVWLGLLLPRAAPSNCQLGAAAPKGDASVAANAGVAAAEAEVSEGCSTGEPYVVLSSPEDAETALPRLNKQFIGNRDTELSEAAQADLAGRETTSVGEANAKHVLQQRVLQLYKDDDLLRDEIYTAVSKLPDATCYQYVKLYVTEVTVESPYLAMAAKVWLGLLLPRAALRNCQLGATAPKGDASAAAKADAAAEAEVSKEKEKLARQQAIKDGAKVFDDFVGLIGALVQLAVYEVKETLSGQLSRLSRFLSNDRSTKQKRS